ncbi:lipid IV(A) 3-deoxy-D-manno-octulosonic acid transferase [Gallaecimonas sp. GXIMD4217]|uniref:lipid IV(A) 3-deoxy-D-manno-octulosonic acid transferase n=1 Tax=Gallaecimonas sp. GXIMD4217 TaxID=3131927 RepID=UPI00311B0311
MARLLYNLLLSCLFPLLLAWLYWPRGRAGFGAKGREHFGLGPSLGQVDIWVHAVSVGEVIAALPLLKQVLAEDPHKRILVTTSSRTGYDRVNEALGDDVLHSYAPYDLWPLVWGFFRRLEARELWIMETELWPNTLAFADKRGIRVSLVNARLSEKSFRQYLRVRPLARDLMRRLDQVLVQTEAEGERFLALGLEAKRLHVTGSIKFDIQVDEAVREQGRALRAGFGQRPVWIAASTHDGEDALLLEAHKRLLSDYPRALLVLVPRHPERFDRVATLIEEQQLAYVRRSSGEDVSLNEQLYLGDTMGEMLVLLGAADLAVMGGSLVPVGGHNLLEPAALALPTLIGPHYFNFQEITLGLVAAGNCKLTSAESLAGDIRDLLVDPARRSAAGEAGLRVVRANQGALARTLSLLLLAE